MKLKVFNPQTLPVVRHGEATVRLSDKGVVALSKRTCEIMNLKAGDGIALHQDEDELSDWYLEKTKDGYTTRTSGGNLTGLMFNASSIVGLFDLNGKTSIRFKIAQEPTIVETQTLFAILTSAVK
jgi:hypothetical protein